MNKVFEHLFSNVIFHLDLKNIFAFRIFINSYMWTVPKCRIYSELLKGSNTKIKLQSNVYYLNCYPECLPHLYFSKCVCVLSHFRHVFENLWIVTCQVPQSMGFSRQEFGSGLPCPPPGDLPYPGIEPVSLMSLALAGGFFTTSTTQEAHLSEQFQKIQE